MEFKLEFSYVPVTGPIVSAVPINPANNGKTVGFAITQIEVFHWEGNRIVRELVLPALQVKSFEDRVKVSVTSPGPVKVVKSHSAIKEPTQLYFLRGEETVFGIHHDIAQLDDIILTKAPIPAGSDEEGTRLMMSTRIGLLDETVEVTLDTFSTDIRGIVKRHMVELETCRTKAQLLDCIDTLRKDIDLAEVLQLKWENASAESLYQEYLERNRV